MQFRNKNPLNMSDSLQVNSPSLESNIFARASPPTYFKRQWIYERLYLHTITDNYIYAWYISWTFSWNFSSSLLNGRVVKIDNESRISDEVYENK